MLFGAGGVLAKVLALVNTFFILSSLTIYQYGVFQLLLSIQATVVILISIAGGSSFVSNDIVRFIGERKESMAKKLFFESYSIRILLGVIVWAGFFFGSDLLTFRYQPDFIFFLKTLSFLFLTETFYSVLKSILTVRLNFKATAIREPLYKLVQLIVLSYFFFFSSIGIKEVLISLVFGSFLSALMLLYPAIKSYSIWAKIKAENEGILLRFFFRHGKWDMFRQVFSKLTFQIQPWLIKGFIGTEAVGIYSAALSMVAVFKSFFATTTLSILIPRQLSNRKSSRFVFVYLSKYLVILGLLLSMAGYFVAPVAIMWLFPQYTPSLLIFSIIILELPIQGLWRITDIFLVALREQKFLFYRSITRNLLHLSLILISLPLIGLWGMAITQVLVALIMAFLSYKYLIKIHPSFAIKYIEFFSFNENDKNLIRKAVKDVSAIIRNKLKFFN